MTYIVSNETMRKSDAAEIGGSVLRSRELMYKAGSSVYDREVWYGKIAIICGSGNNAGDGYVIASCLKNDGYDCDLILADDKFSNDGKYYFDICNTLGINHKIWSADCDLSEYDTIFDCLLGTGFSGNIRYPYSEIINAINSSGTYVVSVDINSGLSGDSGMCDVAVKSNVTYSIGTYKCGHFLGKAKDYIGKLENIDIGIPIIGEKYMLTEKSDFSDIIKPRHNFCNKGDFGYVTLIGGCVEYSGAVKLANLSIAALRSGCGVVKLAIPDCITNSVAPYLLESTLVPLPSKNGSVCFNSVAIDNALRSVKAAAIGMGWGQNGDNKLILEHILQNYDIPVVIDADGLNTLAKMDLNILKTTKCDVVLTPHLKEFERLSGNKIEEVLQDPIKYAKEFAEMYGCTLLLKGTSTIITDGKLVYITDKGCPGMATAGSGDVLSGVIAGILGYSKAPIPLSVACASYICGRAGEIAQSKINSISMCASDTIFSIGDTISEILEN